MTRCLAPDCQMGGLGCDNMTVVLICFLHGKNYEDLADKCAVPNGLKTNSNALLSPSSSSTSSSVSTDDEDMNTTTDSKAVNGDHENESTTNETFSKLNATVNDNGLAVA